MGLRGLGYISASQYYEYLLLGFSLGIASPLSGAGLFHLSKPSAISISRSTILIVSLLGCSIFIVKDSKYASLRLLKIMSAYTRPLESRSKSLKTHSNSNRLLSSSKRPIMPCGVAAHGWKLGFSKMRVRSRTSSS